MTVRIDGSIEGINWAQAKADLAADNFDNGRTPEALRRSFRQSHSKSLTTNGMCIGSDSNGRYSHTDRHRALRLVTGNQTTKELIHEFMTKLPNRPSEATAYRMLRRLKKAGLICKEGKIWVLTESGRHHTSSKMNYLIVLPKIRDEQAS